MEQEKSELLRRADAAMYRAKSLGKNQVVVSRVGDGIAAAGCERRSSNLRRFVTADLHGVAQRLADL